MLGNANYLSTMHVQLCGRKQMSWAILRGILSFYQFRNLVPRRLRQGHPAEEMWGSFKAESCFFLFDNVKKGNGSVEVPCLDFRPVI